MWANVTALSAAEIQRETAAIQKAGREIRKDRATTLAFLQKHGFVTKSGKLSKHYGGSSKQANRVAPMKNDTGGWKSLRQKS